ncbi:N-acetylmuramoyl-L-alanine amidase-like domain-containing protein [Saccharicrinis sp. FJH54]|uniref:N-acetylmuramoyl-L-alanine amidase-like domain-containing protein n=1 Tax=Saccharicrinis sp. FJH54 TaxID=3344665 RepID=UPI0035D490A4
MFRFLCISLLACIFLSCSAQDLDVYYAENSEEILDSILVNQTFTSPEDVALSLVGMPYKSHSLEVQGKERLVVDLTGFDCVTLVENSLALYMANGSKASFLKNLQGLRYRNGEIIGYLSRLHYYTDWILNAEESGILYDVTDRLGGLEYSPSVFFMSSHPDLYPKLQRLTQIDSLKQREQILSNTHLLFIPKQRLTPVATGIKNGDVIAIATNIKGLDFTHVGFALRRNNSLYFLHASSQHHKVMVSAEPLSAYLGQHKHMLGIVVLRLND